MKKKLLVTGGSGTLGSAIDGTANLITAVDKSVFENFVFVSIVGIDHTNHPYYMMKLKVEQLISGSGIPYSILRATKFHE